MPDASRIRQPRDFQETVQLHCPPDVPAPTRALEDLAIPVGRPRSSPVAIPFPDPEFERKGYKDGWRWGLVCGLFWGAIGVVVALQLGRHL
jgi:hypothetical protein